MSNYKPISKAEFHGLEAYLFLLKKYTRSVEFEKKLSTKQRIAIYSEVQYISTAIQVTSRFIKPGAEKPVIIWEQESSELYYFSSCYSLSIALGCSSVAVRNVLDHSKPHKTVDGYRIAYYSDIKDSTPLKF